VADGKKSHLYTIIRTTLKREKIKKHHDLIAVLRECPKGGQPRRQPWPPRDFAPSARVTTGGLSAPVSRQKTGCHLLWIDGFWGLLSRLHFLTSILRSLR
jgi:hypothetical protein